MQNKNKILKIQAKYIISSIIIILVVPLILNLIIGIPALDIVIADDKTWLTFWGNYLGAIISGFIAFVILYLTIQANQKQQLNVFQNDEKWKLKNAIAERLPHFNYSRLLLLKSDLDGSVDVGYEKAKIDSMYSQISDDFNSFSLLYGRKYPEFCMKYRNAIDDFQERLRLINKELSHIERKPISDLTSIEYDARKIKELIDSSLDTREVVNNLWKEAENILDTE